MKGAGEAMNSGYYIMSAEELDHDGLEERENWGLHPRWVAADR